MNILNNNKKKKKNDMHPMILKQIIQRTPLTPDSNMVLKF